MKTLNKKGKNLLFYRGGTGATIKVECPCGNTHIFRESGYRLVRCLCGELNDVLLER